MLGIQSVRAIPGFEHGDNTKPQCSWINAQQSVSDRQAFSERRGGLAGRGEDGVDMRACESVEERAAQEVIIIP